MTTTLRIPKGLWKDLEESIILQDRQFLSEVAIQLGLPIQEVLRKCLGTGTPQVMPVLWAPMDSLEDASQCPWWECHGEGLWRRCPRLRLSPTLPCHFHERCTPCPLARLDSDPYIKGLPWFEPVSRQGLIYWVDPAGTGATFHEDGRVCADGKFILTTHKGKKVAIWCPFASTFTEEGGETEDTPTTHTDPT